MTETLEATRSLLGAVVKPLAGVIERFRGDAGEPWGDVCGVGVTTRDIAHACVMFSDACSSSEAAVVEV